MYKQFPNKAFLGKGKQDNRHARISNNPRLSSKDLSLPRSLAIPFPPAPSNPILYQPLKKAIQKKIGPLVVRDLSGEKRG